MDKAITLAYKMGIKNYSASKDMMFIMSTADTSTHQLGLLKGCNGRHKQAERARRDVSCRNYELLNI